MPDPLSRAISQAIIAGWPGLAGPLRALISGTAELGIVAAIAIIIAAAWLQESGDLREHVMGFARSIAPALIAVAIGFLAVKVVGALVTEARPFVVLGVTPLIPHGADASFPSEHTTLGFAMLAARLRSRGVQVAVAAIVAIVGTARVLAGVHWPVDIVGAIILGLAIALVIGWLWDRFIPSPARTRSGSGPLPVAR